MISSKGFSVLVRRFWQIVLMSFINYLFAVFERFSTHFLTYHVRPKGHDGVRLLKPCVSNSDDDVTAVVMQGPILLNNDFTFETLKLYGELFPQARLILSTWEDENAEVLMKITELGIDVVINKKPIYAGPANINLQIVSASAGIMRAKEIGCRYALKTRTDQRIYSENSLRLCRGMLRLFPLQSGLCQKDRLVAFNLNTFKYRLYGISDMINFGNIDDMLDYWSPGLDQRKISELGDAKTLYEFSRQRFAEVYFTTSFLAKIGRDINWSLEDSFSVIADHFCILNASDIDLFWPKYTRKEFRHVGYQLIRTAQFEFSDWISLQGDKQGDVPEYIIHTEIAELDRNNVMSLNRKNHQ